MRGAPPPHPQPLSPQAGARGGPRPRWCVRRAHDLIEQGESLFAQVVDLAEVGDEAVEEELLGILQPQLAITDDVRQRRAKIVAQHPQRIDFRVRLTRWIEPFLEARSATPGRTHESFPGWRRTPPDRARGRRRAAPPAMSMRVRIGGVRAWWVRASQTRRVPGLGAGVCPALEGGLVMRQAPVPSGPGGQAARAADPTQPFGIIRM